MSPNESVLWNGPVDTGLPGLQHFKLQQDVDPGDPGEGELLVEVLYISVDPYMRGRMRTGKNFVPSFVPGQPLESLGVVRVAKVGTGVTDVTEGTHGMVPMLRWLRVQKVARASLLPVDVQVCRDTGLPLSVWLGALGMTGFTAYSSLERIGKPKPTDTAFVSGAAGAVGLIVGQLLKNVYKVSRVVGSAGSDNKVKLLLELGYDAAFNYKAESVQQAVPRLCPNGIDLYYDNVGGETLEAALEAANVHARVVACGSISQYNSSADERYGIKNLFQVVSKRILIQGFIQSDYADLRPQFYKDMSAYLKEGKVKHLEHIVMGGLAAAGQAFIDMMNGVNTGKMVVVVGKDPFRTEA